MVYADLYPGYEDSKIRITASHVQFPLVDSLPGRTRHREDWSVPLSWASVIAIKAAFASVGVEVSDELRAWVRSDYNKRVLPALILRGAVDLEKTDISAITDPKALELIKGAKTLEHPTGRTRYPHQTTGAAFLAIARRALLGDEQGAGKTTTVISALRVLQEQGEDVFPCLVTGPNTTKIGWQREFDLVWPGRKVEVVTGTPDQKRKILVEPADVYILNWEALRVHSRLQAYGGVAFKKCTEHGGLDPKVTRAGCDVHRGELNDIDFKSVIADEAHRAKDPASKVTRALKYASGDAQLRFALTGTPIADTPDDLWSVLNWIAPEEWPGRQAFITQFCATGWNDAGYQKVTGLRSDMTKQFFSSFDPRMRRMPKKLVLKFLPPIVHERRDVTMGAKQAKAYRQMSEQMVAELGDEMLVTTSPLVKTTRLLQFSSANAEIIPPEVSDDDVPLEEEDTPPIRISLTAPSCKVDAFMDDIDDFEGQSVVIFAASRQLIMLLSERMKREEIEHALIVGGQTLKERQREMDRFQAGEVQFVLCTTGAGGTGITLTQGSTAVFLQRPWSSVENGQAEARVHRIGSEIHSSVTILDYVAENTIEDAVLASLAGKGARLEEILRDRELLLKMLDTPLPEKVKSVRKSIIPAPAAGTVPDLIV